MNDPLTTSVEIPDQIAFCLKQIATRIGIPGAGLASIIAVIVEHELQMLDERDILNEEKDA